MSTIDHVPGSLRDRLGRLEQKLDRQAGLIAECSSMLLILHNEQCQAMRRIEALEATLRTRAALTAGGPDGSTP